MILQINNLTKFYGEQQVLNISELHIEQKEAIGLVGNNGAGKTTLLRIIMDLILPNSGNVLIDDKPYNNNPEIRSFVSGFLDESFLIPFLTAEEYFDFITHLYRISKIQKEECLSLCHKFLGDEVLGKKKYISHFSSGNKQKIGIVGALLTQPKLLLLDEPFANIDPSTQIQLKHIIKQIHQQWHTTAIISSHNLDHITDVSTRILLLEKGLVIKNLENQENLLSTIIDYFEKQ